METLKDVMIKVLLFIAAMPLIIAVVAGGYTFAVVVGAIICVAFIFKAAYNILFK